MHANEERDHDREERRKRRALELERGKVETGLDHHISREKHKPVDEVESDLDKRIIDLTLKALEEAGVL